MGRELGGSRPRGSCCGRRSSGGPLAAATLLLAPARPCRGVRREQGVLPASEQPFGRRGYVLCSDPGEQAAC